MRRKDDAACDFLPWRWGLVVGASVKSDCHLGERALEDELLALRRAGGLETTVKPRQYQRASASSSSSECCQIAMAYT